MSLAEEHIMLKRRYESLSSGVEVLQTRNKELLESNNVMLQNLMNCQKALDITKENMRNALTMQNEIKDAYSADIQELKAEIKRLKNGDNN